MSFSPRTGVVVQMRMDSKRLPGKALLPLGGTTLAGMVMRALHALAADEHILATDSEGASKLARVARENGFTVFEGPKDDVLARYAMAAEKYALDRVVRATGDNPFVSIELARLAMDLSVEPQADYTGLLGMPVGMGVEVIKVTALNEAHRYATAPYDREHVCPYIYNHPEQFKILRPKCPFSHWLPEGRLTIDTEADYQSAIEIIGALGNSPGDAGLLSWLRSSMKGVR